jgi:hypothetical protein
MTVKLRPLLAATMIKTSGEGHVARAPATCAGSAAAIIADDPQRLDGGRELEVRSEADDIRVCIHESSHALTGRLVGAEIGGVTVEPSIDGNYSGLTWGPSYDRRAKFADERSAPVLCEQIAPLMPKPGESRADVAPIFLHVHNRLVEIVAGTEGERAFLSGEPWYAADDERQAVAYASLITTSPKSAAALIEFARVEATALLEPRAHIIHALAEALRIHRTLTTVLACNDVIRERRDVVLGDFAGYLLAQPGPDEVAQMARNILPAFNPGAHPAVRFTNLGFHPIDSLLDDLVDRLAARGGLYLGLAQLLDQFRRGHPLQAVDLATSVLDREGLRVVDAQHGRALFAGGSIGELEIEGRHACGNDADIEAGAFAVVDLLPFSDAPLACAVGQDGAGAACALGDRFRGGGGGHVLWSCDG